MIDEKDRLQEDLENIGYTGKLYSRISVFGVFIVSVVLGVGGLIGAYWAVARLIDIIINKPLI